MIPDELIGKAKSAYINRCGKVCSHDSLVAAFEAIAADIWDAGYEVGRFDGGCTSYTRPEDRPYRASETA